MKRSVLVLVSVALASNLLLAASVLGKTLDEANRAFMEHRIDEALQLYETLALGQGDSADRANAASMAALIQWRFYKKHDEAAGFLKEATAGGCNETPLLLARSRLERDRGDFQTAWSASCRALQQAESPHEQRDARIEKARVAVEESFRAARQGSECCDYAKLEEARADLLTLMESGENFLEVSRLLLQAALLLGDGKTALEAWHSYFRIEPGAEAYGLLALPQKGLSDIWPTWQGASDKPETNYRVIDLLAESRLYKEAVVLGDLIGVGQEAPDEIKDILTYGRAMWDLEEFFNEQYRLYVGGQTDPRATMAGFVERLCSVWNESSWSEGPCPAPIPFDITDPEAVASGLRVIGELANRFGMVVRISGDGSDISLGHAIVRQTREIEQYKRRVQFTYYLLESMVANGWPEWAFDARTGYGGWGTVQGDGYAQIRRYYADAPIAAWNKATDPETREKFEQKIARESKNDWTRAKEDPYAYLPGLAGRLELAAYDDLLAQLKGEGLKGSKLRQEFIARCEKAWIESDIFAHEGRHIIDGQLGIFVGEELEYRAKLSAVAFAPSPRLAFGSIIDEEMGKDTPHGQADLHIMKDIVSWMRGNADKISGIDLKRPLLPQFDLLTDEQMREIMRSNDPLAKGEP
jgi:hypothetical protein